MLTSYERYLQIVINGYTPPVEVTQDNFGWSFRQSMQLCLDLNLSRAWQVLKHPYTPLVKVNQAKFFFQRVYSNVNIHILWKLYHK